MRASGKTGIYLGGVQAMQGQLRLVADKHRKQARLVVYRIAQKIIDRAQDEFVPEDTGELSGTGRVELVTVSGSRVQAIMSFDGPAAIPIHEHLSRFSPYSWQVAEGSGGVLFQPGGRGPKYLERPLLEEIPRIPRDIEEGLDL